MRAGQQHQLGDFVMRLAEYNAGGAVFNPWRDHDPLDSATGSAATDRRTRLYQHFSVNPSLLLVGEAPGYQGCRFSGVPFTSERLISEGAVPRVIPASRFTTRELQWTEPSATIVWKVLHALNIADTTVMWNAFPFHPFEPGKPHSNRRPTEVELEVGSIYMLNVLKLFSGARLVAVGNVAHELLSGMVTGEVLKVRHPANGGAVLFADGLREILGEKKAAP